MKSIYLLHISLIVFFSCSRDCRLPDGFKQIEVEFKTKPMENIMADLSTFEEVVAFLDSEATFSEKYLERYKFPDDTLLVNQVLALNADQNIDSLRLDVKKAFPDFEGQYREAFTDLFRGIRFHFEEFKIPTVYTAITGFGNDVFYFDTMLVLSLDYFAGDSSKYKPDLPYYMNKRYGPSYVVPMSALAISERYNRSDFLDQSLIAEMIYYGKAYYFMERTMPCLHDSMIIGYTNAELKLAEDYKKNIWAHLIDQNVLFETKHPIVNKYIGERPFTAEVSPKCPGRIGRWVGRQIVRKYMDMNPNVTLAELMAEKNARMIFETTKYKP